MHHEPTKVSTLLVNISTLSVYASWTYQNKHTVSQHIYIMNLPTFKHNLSMVSQHLCTLPIYIVNKVRRIYTENIAIVVYETLLVGHTCGAMSMTWA